MDGLASAHEDGDSDYGSEIHSDEEVSLTELIQQAPTRQATAPPLVLKDIEDHETPRSARLPRKLGHERRQRAETPVHSPEQKPRSRIAVEIESYRSVSAPGKSTDLRH